MFPAGLPDIRAAASRRAARGCFATLQESGTGGDPASPRSPRVDPLVTCRRRLLPHRLVEAGRLWLRGGVSRTVPLWNTPDRAA
jgi:hypothetical protein